MARELSDLHIHVGGAVAPHILAQQNDPAVNGHLLAKGNEVVARSMLVSIATLLGPGAAAAAPPARRRPAT